MTAVSLSKRRGYHVGNVRVQLLSAARDLLQEEGKARLSLRSIAGRTGVAPGTVYYHYADKHALLAGLAIDGFKEMAAAMREAVRTRGELSGLRAAGLAYIAFVKEKPALYELMYDAREHGRRADVAAAEQAAFQILADAIADDLEGRHPPERARQAAQALWAFGRGAATLALTCGEPGDGPQAEVIEDSVAGLEFLILGR
ncbi:MAG: TetR/AcrR family transcriptional regulator [Phenylobacterium sp.]|uniref:TetR/AcrR family transcriptional regulator n=1 Tax=Phenylobacterium sp. TaxID=1871053 RepID=UPI00391D87BD